METNRDFIISMKKVLSFGENQKGYSLVELLAVIVILGIISSVGIISMTKVIAMTKDQAFVGNAITLKDAAHLYLKDEEIQGNPYADITYDKLLQLNYLDKIKDPFTGGFIPEDNKTFIRITDKKISGVCFYGNTHNLCTKDGVKEPIPIDQLSVDLIKPNK
ncbi:type II secretion system protein [Neobacillus niacini]|uniref:type II secretion system protein n=1 Tax=Neobacillus niacini TaxID=86668 RepID=UPI00203F3B0A|nr:type II secretion system protein [Neobacillus niacini]MCM3692254.1 type II secretion system GspH family protein [Neobacillus niacini]